ncbi:MAG TPA: PQQ-dependent sugar dehydrogenase [Gemmatimonadaceae bacterium]|nr:PQQ-dependent sugar dehydrogenase [Gemmatimonadaceae bacterium]
MSDCEAVAEGSRGAGSGRPAMWRLALLAVAATTAACARGESSAAADSAAARAGDSTARVGGAAACDNAGLQLPAGFCATIFADKVGGARHIAIAPNGDVFVQLISAKKDAESGSGATGGILALRDVNGDGKADTTVAFGEVGGTGIGLHDGYIYGDDKSKIVRWKLPAGSLTPQGDAETIVSGLPTGGHEARNFAFDTAGALYVNVGSRTNSCQQKDRANQSPGVDPCVELQTRAGIWKFAANKTNQTPSVSNRFATGIRNGMGLMVSPLDGKVYTTQHGRDQLTQNWSWPQQSGADNPAEEFMQVNQGDDFGWPYCYYSVSLKKLVLAPEYGGDSTKVGRCAQKKEPLAFFPGHWAPMASLVYTGSQFPAHYKGGVFIAFHGSWNRAPEPQAGYRVAFLPMQDGKASGNFETFADNFANGKLQPDAAEHRPVGLAQAPDGSLFVTDDKGGRIYKITYKGK